MSAPMLDLAEFASLEDALIKVEPGERYLGLGRELMAVATEFEPNTITDVLVLHGRSRPSAALGNRT